MKFPGPRMGLAVAVIVIGISASCASGPLVRASTVRGELRGMVYDLDRQPVSDTTITLAFAGKEVSGITDLHGRFGFSDVPFGGVELTILKSGFETFQWAFRFIDSSQVLYVQLSSAEQLLERAALSLDQKLWQDFDSYLKRAKDAKAPPQQTLILEVAGLEKRGRAQEALNLLLANEPHPASFAWELLTARVFQSMGQQDQALVHWKRALGIREDLGLRTRVEELSKE